MYVNSWPNTAEARLLQVALTANEKDGSLVTARETDELALDTGGAELVRPLLRGNTRVGGGAKAVKKREIGLLPSGQLDGAGVAAPRASEGVIVQITGVDDGEHGVARATRQARITSASAHRVASAHTISRPADSFWPIC